MNRREYDPVVSELKTDISNIAVRQKECRSSVQKNTERILLILEGNGSDGLVTKVAMNQTAINRAWRFLYFVLFGILGLAIKVVAFS